MLSQRVQQIEARKHHLVTQPPGGVGMVSAVGLRARRGLAAATLAAALLATVARAATPLPGATYSGALSERQAAISISFRVSPDGREVEAVTFSELPIYCTGSGPPNARIVFATARISRRGTFTARGRDAIAVGPLKGTAVASLTLTGTFASKGRASGVVRTDYVGTASKCSGRSRYTTKA